MVFACAELEKKSSEVRSRASRHKLKQVENRHIPPGHSVSYSAVSRPGLGLAAIETGVSHKLAHAWVIR